MKTAALLFASVMAAHGATYFVTVAGLGGMAEYETQFEKWAADLDRELKTNGANARVETLSGASANRQHIEELFSRLSAEAKPDDAFALFLIGHGTFDGTDYKLNIPGPDITAAEIAALLNHIPATRQLVVNMSSCSGASLAALAKKDRIVITATKSGNEKNATVFARYWIDALRDPAADADKNGTVSAIEAYQYTQRKTAGYFEAEKLLATEHSLFTDTGAANAERDPKPATAHGLLAAAFALKRPPSESDSALTPDKQQLARKKEDLEARIDRLKYQKAGMPADEYKQQLTVLLLDLARTQAEIDK
jgi:Peptidase C13 family